MKIYAYLRVSTDQQAESGAGLDAQIESCENYARRNDLFIHKFFRDEGISGAAEIEKRPGLSEALNELKKGDVLLVAKRDRLARGDNMSTIQIKVKKKKARLISCAGEGTEGDQDDPSNYMMRGITDFFSGFERILIKSRTKAALQAMKRDNKRVGHIPFGYRLAKDGVHLEEDAEEKDILKQMLELREQGLSLRKIADELNRRKAFTRGKVKWNHVSVHGMIKRAA